MNAPLDPKTVTPVQVTTGSLPGSKKVYSAPEDRADIEVPFREIALHESSGEPPFRVYDTSGPYSDEAAKIGVSAGLKRIREPWVRARGVEQYQGRGVKPEDDGNVGETHRAREFPLLYAALAGQVTGRITQLEFARAGTITEDWLISRTGRIWAGPPHLTAPRKRLPMAKASAPPSPNSSRPNSYAARLPAAAPLYPPTSITPSSSR